MYSRPYPRALRCRTYAQKPTVKHRIEGHSEVRHLSAATSTQTSPSGKRKRDEFDYLNDEISQAEANNLSAGIQTPAAPKRPKKDAGEEKRLGVFRKKAPQSYIERLERAQSQRMFLLDRHSSQNHDSVKSWPEETFDLAGTTGNVYQVKIAKKPCCTCPDNKKGNQCKHIIYVSDLAPLPRLSITDTAKLRLWLTSSKRRLTSAINSPSSRRNSKPSSPPLPLPHNHRPRRPLRALRAIWDRAFASQSKATAPSA